MAKPFHYSTEKWHNVRYTRNGKVSTDFEMSLADAVNTGLFQRSGLDGLEKVEYAGTQYVGAWEDVTAEYKRQYRQGAH